MLRLAFRNLFQNKVRLVVSAGGIALALMLILALDAVLTGVEGQITAYIDNSKADVWVSQSGVQNLHMVTSSIPTAVTEEVENMQEVESATPIMYLTNLVVSGENRNLAYVIGLPEDAEAGKPSAVVEGVAIPGEGEAVIDNGVARKWGVEIGDEVAILGKGFTVAGLSEGDSSMINSVAFISMADFAGLGSSPEGSPDTVSYVLAQLKPGESAGAVAERIEADVGGVTAQSGEEFAAQERNIVTDMTTELVALMNVVGLLIGLAVVALTVYVATLSRREEYGVLKALGAKNRHLYGVVLAQAIYSVALGFAVGLAFTLLLAAVAPVLTLNLSLEISGASLLKVGAMSLVIAGFAAILPIRQISGLDPATVFRGK